MEKVIISVYAQTFPKEKRMGGKDEDEVAIINKVVIERGGTLPSERLFDHHPLYVNITKSHLGQFG